MYPHYYNSCCYYNNCCPQPPQKQVWRERIPFERSSINFIPQSSIEYVPQERSYVDYIELEHNYDTIPVPRYEKKVDYVPIDRYQEQVTFEPYERSQVVPNAGYSECYAQSYPVQEAVAPIRQQCYRPASICNFEAAPTMHVQEPIMYQQHLAQQPLAQSTYHSSEYFPQQQQLEKLENQNYLKNSVQSNQYIQYQPQQQSQQIIQQIQEPVVQQQQTQIQTTPVQVQQTAATVQPVQVQPVEVQPVQVQPVQVQPVYIQPVQIQPVQIQPVQQSVQQVPIVQPIQQIQQTSTIPVTKVSQNQLPIIAQQQVSPVRYKLVPVENQQQQIVQQQAQIVSQPQIFQSPLIQSTPLMIPQQQQQQQIVYQPNSIISPSYAIAGQDAKNPLNFTLASDTGKSTGPQIQRSVYLSSEKKKNKIFS